MSKARKRSSRKASRPEKLAPRPSCPWCGGIVLEFVWATEGIHNYECLDGGHGIMEDVIQFNSITTSLGKAVVVKRLQLLDQEPEILASGLNVLHHIELAWYATASPEDRAKAWDRRMRVVNEYRALKAKHPELTVDDVWPV